MHIPVNKSDYSINRWFTLALLFVVMTLQIDMVMAQSGEISAQRRAIQSILSEDTRLGSQRNNAPFERPIHLAVSQYVDSLEKLDYSAAPPVFHFAFKQHINAWTSTIELLKNHQNERGEMHDVFNRIHAIEPRLKPLEKAIWDTWAPVASIAKFYRSDTASSQFVFTSNRSGNSEIYRGSLDSRHYENLTEHPASDNWPVVSPDGKTLVFQSRRGGKFDIFSLTLANRELVQLTDHEAHDYLPSFSPDGRTIYFTSWRHQANEKAQARFYKMNFDGQTQARWTTTVPGNSTGVHWLNDGKSALTSLSTPSDSNESSAQIFRIDDQGKKIKALTQLAGYNAGATLSPGGNLMAFYSQTEKAATIGIMDLLEPTKPIRWIVSEGFNWQPKFSLDGQWLSYSKSRDPEHQDLDIFVIEVANPVVEIPLIDSPARDAEFSWIN